MLHNMILEIDHADIYEQLLVIFYMYMCVYRSLARMVVKTTQRQTRCVFLSSSHDPSNQNVEDYLQQMDNRKNILADIGDPMTKVCVYNNTC